MNEIQGGVTAAKGYKAIGGAVGIKQDSKDMAILISDVPATAAGAFTTNVVKATSVLRNMEIMEQKQYIKGIVINSGNANACTGIEGEKANQEMAETLANCLNVGQEQILTASTGVIGTTFPIEKVKNGIAMLFPKLGETLEHGHLAAEGIMTTDTYSKEIAVQLEIGGKTVTIGGMAKGSGMIHPNMATMLAFITSDVCIKRELLDEILKQSIQTTYNMVSVDGDTSTNDTVIVLANGMAGNTEITEKNADYEAFKNALHTVNTKLAKDLVRDGEGATKFIEVNVIGAKTQQDAKIMAKSVVTSNLVKTAMYGQDANWGRVLCAMGYSGVHFDTKKVDIVYYSAKGSIDLMIQGSPIVFDEQKAAEILSEKEIVVEIKIQEGNEKATAWGCDLSHEYVSINGDYRS
ncbi:bifunctional ornithine acetyltransferase/N-acetylglutamate synthase [Clostridium sp. MD294]|uniref:bifunctional ornithine acetyltransferase/N-acetylglutamate synthase n=1 Tax=Clostridium sp. MD294 TaxID=97138 RepID=UPI0002CAAEEF|nr:bifunctional ornithine acetyltransferase/N-acetylglutamate synthase [Clostridium sp. MD294]NDO46348.1 bifunctional ornithine acetyltransferase/N-acetylglutamate synthase [Clostridium sp. MD294]USF29225.1 Arginine biosynthesis bifunctional protein ArgJ [Clostridium sp. MD294]